MVIFTHLMFDYHPSTHAFDLLKSGMERELRGEVPAEARFEHRIAERHYIHEHSLRTSYGDVLVLLWWKREQILIDIDEYEERQADRRWEE